MPEEKKNIFSGGLPFVVDPIVNIRLHYTPSQRDIKLQKLMHQSPVIMGGGRSQTGNITLAMPLRECDCVWQLSKR